MRIRKHHRQMPPSEGFYIEGVVDNLKRLLDWVACFKSKLTNPVNNIQL